MALRKHRSLSLLEATKSGHSRHGRSPQNPFAGRASEHTVAGHHSSDFDVVSPARVLSPKANAFMSMLLPFHQFSKSVFGVPSLLLLRLFYQASPYELTGASLSAESGSATTPRLLTLREDARGQNKLDLLDEFAKHDATQFYLEAQSVDPGRSNLRLMSVTWVKALGSPLSHEYLQFIVEDVSTGQRWRLVADRSDQGDIVIVGWNWASESYASHHHKLPLPLLTLSYENSEHKPALLDVAARLSQTSKQRRYNLMREMCWWYAETVFSAIHADFPAGKIQQWPFGHLRYSFIVRTEWVQRKTLVAQAETFREQNMTAMRY